MSDLQKFKQFFDELSIEYTIEHETHYIPGELNVPRIWLNIKSPMYGKEQSTRLVFSDNGNFKGFCK